MEFSSTPNKSSPISRHDHGQRIPVSRHSRSSRGCQMHKITIVASLEQDGQGGWPTRGWQQLEACEIFASLSKQSSTRHTNQLDRGDTQTRVEEPTSAPTDTALLLVHSEPLSLCLTFTSPKPPTSTPQSMNAISTPRAEFVPTSAELV
jgi:hypothetical protein